MTAWNDLKRTNGRLDSVQLTTAAHFQEKLNRNTSGAAAGFLCCMRRIGKQVKILYELVTVIGECSCSRLEKSSHWETGKAADGMETSLTIWAAGNMMIRQSGDLPE